MEVIIQPNQEAAADLTARYPRLALDDLNHGGGMVTAALQGLVLPGVGDVLCNRTFASEADLEAYVRDPGYGTAAMPKLWAAIVFAAGAPHWRYTLRLNAS